MPKPVVTPNDTSPPHWEMDLGIRGYIVSVDRFKVIQTRGQHSDTLEVYLTAHSGDQAYPVLQELWGDKEDDDEGPMRCQIGPVPIADPSQQLVLFYQFLNNGSSQTKEDALAYAQTAGSFIAGKLADEALKAGFAGKLEVGGAFILWAGIIKLTVDGILPHFLEGCDGPCAVGGAVATGKSLHKYEVVVRPKADPPAFDYKGYGRVTVFRGERWHKSEFEIGGPTPHGCGASPEYYVWWSILSSEWSGWLRWPGGGLSALRLTGAAEITGTLHVFAKALTDGTILQNDTKNGVVWSGWKIVPGLQTDRPLVAVAENPRLWLFARNESNRQLYCRLNEFDQGWTDWINLDQSFTVGSFAAAPFGKSEILRIGAQMVVFRHSGDPEDGQVFWSVQHDWGTGPPPTLAGRARFGPWDEIPMSGSGGLTGGLTALNWRGTVFLFGVGRDHVVYFNMLDPDNTWRGWTHVGERFETDIDCGVGAAVCQTRFGQMLKHAYSVVRGNRLHVFAKPGRPTGDSAVAQFCSLRSMPEGLDADWTTWRDVPGSWANDGLTDGLTGDPKPPVSMGVGVHDDAPGVAVFKNVLYLLGEDAGANLWLNTWDGTDREDLVVIPTT